MGRFGGSIVALVLLAAASASGADERTAAPPNAIPLAMTMCEEGCPGAALWTFKGKQGLGIWRNGATAFLAVERWDSGGITIRRKEIATPFSRNIEGLYSGRLEGNTITGTMSWWVPGMKPKSAPWTARIGNATEQQVQARLQLHLVATVYPPPGTPAEVAAYATDLLPRPPGAIAAADPSLLPLAFSECEMEGCALPSSWTFSGKTGVALWSTGATANLSIERFDREAVIIQRTEVPTPISRDIVALYTGRINGDRVEGTMTWTAPGLMEPITKPWWTTIGTPEQQAALLDQQVATLRARQRANDEAAWNQMMMLMGVIALMGSSDSGSGRGQEKPFLRDNHFYCSYGISAYQRGVMSRGEAQARCR